MKVYEVTLTTSLVPHSGTYCGVQITLIGARGESLPASLDHEHQLLTPGSACAITMKTQNPLGPVVLVRLCLEARPGFPEQDWHCQAVEVILCRNGNRQVDLFPCNKWLRPADGAIELRNGRVCTVDSETLQMLKEHRTRELQTKQQNFR
ncbi:hypothetical protein SKAU_G00167460 [Synaphobranchus kaupii]|uniref:PLAT domain-containing protein n=1 Tax=Synaphobranchus kaupii TaxID=118154 RepID=A0A9Q1FJV8_SYNKA|nr:hypothetical protein SKAU_G00167460 [Synaphobranchus kaupii]